MIHSWYLIMFRRYVYETEDEIKGTLDLDGDYAGIGYENVEEGGKTISYAMSKIIFGVLIFAVAGYGYAQYQYEAG